MIPPLALEVTVVCLGVFLLMLDAFSSGARKSYLAIIGAAVLMVLFVCSFFLGQPPEALVSSGFYVLDGPGLFFKQFMLLATALVLLMTIDFAPVFSRYIPAERPGAGVGELMVLPLFTCAGLMWMSTAADFIMIFVSLELVTISFYVMIASMRKNKASLEAGVKYLILGALSTGFLVYGITWVFGSTGSTALNQIAATLPNLSDASYTPLLFGFALILVSLGFKVAAAPFQFWVPDVYQGAPTPVTAFLSVASKAAGFIVLIRVLQAFLGVSVLREKILMALAVIAGLTIIYGNLAAMPQTNFKRLLAYSSVAHAGYLLLGIVSVVSGLAGTAVSFYLAAYFLMTFSAFFVLVLVARHSQSDEIADFNGLSKRSPYLAFTLLLAMLSLAGLPFTVGFLGKFFIFQSAIFSGLYWLVAIGAVAVACGFYYYFKVIRAMYWQVPSENAEPIAVSPLTQGVLLILSAAIIFFGIFPQPILAMVG